jgi:hypothetical protein
MYGLPKNLDLGFFDRKVLLQVCFGAHDLILNFDGGLSIAISSSIGFTRPDIRASRHANFRDAAGTLLTLINRQLVSAGTDGRGTLILSFEQGETISIYDDSSQYESYTIKNRDQLIVV